MKASTKAAKVRSRKVIDDDKIFPYIIDTPSGNRYSRLSSDGKSVGWYSLHNKDMNDIEKFMILVKHSEGNFEKHVIECKHRYKKAFEEAEDLYDMYRKQYAKRS